jgi:sec-independent protein translocase protein TatB
MLGLTMEKLLVVAFIAALLIGPHRLPAYAARLAAAVRRLRTLLDDGRGRMEAELGVPLGATDWRNDLRKYDPRQIIRDALNEPEPTRMDAETGPGGAPPAQQYRWAPAGGSSGHPRRIRVPMEMDVEMEGEEAPSVHRPATNASSAS